MDYDILEKKHKALQEEHAALVVEHQALGEKYDSCMNVTKEVIDTHKYLINEQEKIIDRQIREHCARMYSLVTRRNNLIKWNKIYFAMACLSTATLVVVGLVSLFI